MVTRRFFIGGAASFGAFAGCRFLKVPAGSCSNGRPNLRFGVVSDIHISRAARPGDRMDGWANDLTFRHALAWFRDRGVDAVMIAGDMADYGMVEELAVVGKAWDDIFPDNRGLDGRPVEKLFVCGNHDYHGFLYGDHAKKLYPDENECRRHILRADIAGHWKRIFHEDYSLFRAKTVNGYTFLGRNWDDGKGIETRYGNDDCHAFEEQLKAWLAAKGGSLDPKRPFFYFQHPHPKDTCYGPWAWGHDNGKTTEILSKYPNAIAFSGHSHYSLTDERTVWQGAFTSVGTSTLRYVGLPYDEYPNEGYENSQLADAVKAMAKLKAADGRQGMLWSVSDEAIVVNRRDFLADESLGEDWVLPLTTAESRPFAFAERAQKALAPQFAADAVATVETCEAKPRPTAKVKDPAPKPAVRLTFPAALAEPKARPFDYEVAAVGTDGTRKVFHVLAEGYHRPRKNARVAVPMICTLFSDRLPKAVSHYEITPRDCWHTRGRPLKVEVKSPMAV